MKTVQLIKGDLKFQHKYGFFALYFIMTILYILLISCIPEKYKMLVGAFVIITDPAALGLFFMGAIVLLEKSQNILSSINVAPIDTLEYIMSKAVSIGILSFLVGVILSLYAKIHHVFLSSIGIFLCSIIFTLLGIIVASVSKSLNQFIVYSVPFEIICFFPVFVYFIKPSFPGLKLHPLVLLINFMTTSGKSYLGFFIETMILILFLLWICVNCVDKRLFLRK